MTFNPAIAAEKVIARGDALAVALESIAAHEEHGLPTGDAVAYAMRTAGNLRALADHIGLELSQQIFPRPADTDDTARNTVLPIERPISGDLMEYIAAVEQGVTS